MCLITLTRSSEAIKSRGKGSSPNSDGACNFTQVVTLKARQEEAERLASSANLAKVKAAEAQAAEAEAVVEHLRAMVGALENPEP